MAVGALISLIAVAIDQANQAAGARGDAQMRPLYNLYNRLQDIQSRYKSGQLRDTAELTKVYKDNEKLLTKLGADIQWYNGIVDGFQKEMASNTLRKNNPNLKSEKQLKEEYQKAQVQGEYRNTLAVLKQWKDSSIKGENLYEKENITQKI